MEVDGGFVSLIFHQPDRAIVTEVVVLRNRVRNVLIEREFQANFARPCFWIPRIVLGLKQLRPLIRVQGLEHPVASVCFYGAAGRNGKSWKIVEITSSQQVGSRLMAINDQDYETIMVQLLDLQRIASGL